MTELDVEAIRESGDFLADPSLVPRLLDRVEELEAQRDRVWKAVWNAHAHRFDHEGNRDDRLIALQSVGVDGPVAGGPDIFYNGINYALSRIRAALEGEG